MDQNYQNHQPFGEGDSPFAPVVRKNAKYYRARAREALKGKWVHGSLGTFCYTALIGIVASAAVLIGMIPMFAMIFARLLSEDVHTMEAGAPGIVLGGMGLMLLFVFAATIFFGGPLIVGYCRMQLDVIDGKPVEIATLFTSFKNGYWKSVGLYGLYMLFSLVALLPMLGGVLLGVVFGALASLASETLAMVILLSMFGIGYVLTFVALFIFLFRYGLSFYIRAEYPEMRAIDVLRNSASLMRGNKWKLFCLSCSFIGWILLLSPVGILTCGIGMSIGMYVLYTYMYYAQAAFYDDVANRAAARETEFPSLDPDDYDPNAVKW